LTARPFLPQHDCTALVLANSGLLRCGLKKRAHRGANELNAKGAINTGE
jgi:hypothetical protein